MTDDHSFIALRVLLVEDSAYDRDAFQRAVKKSDMSVTLSVCVRAEEALQLLEEEPPAFDLIVSDHNLPGMSGLEFCREVIRRHIPLPTVLLTGGGSEHLAVEALKSGVSDYLMKDSEGGYLRLLPVVLPEVVKQYHERLFRQQAEDALRASEEQFRHAFEYTAVGMALTSLEGRFLRVNRAWCDMLGYTEEHLLKMTIREITHPDDMALNAEAIQHVIAGKQTCFRMEKRYLHRQGQVVWGYLSATLVRNASGKPRHFISQLQDITERKQMEDELRQERALLAERVRERTEELSKANAELSRAIRLKDEFLAIMSHELRTPLNAVLGMSGALLEGGYGDLDARQLGAVRRVDENGRHLLALITDILDLSEIGAGKWELRCHSFPVESVYQASVRLLHQTIRQKQLKISSLFDSAVTTMYADERRMKQALVHLLSNAVKFTPEGGQIGIITEGSVEDGTLSFTVWDSGIGMPREGMETLFLPFTQADSSLSRRFNGAGVGLSLVYHIVHMHGGSLLVESVENEGSRFTATFPWRAEEPGGRGHADRMLLPFASPANSSGGNCPETNRLANQPESDKGLVVLAADHEQTLAYLSSYFTTNGWQTMISRNGREILTCMDENRPDLVILGGDLPNTDTEKLIRQIHQRHPMLPLVMLTALELPGDCERYLDAGAMLYRRKPLNEPALEKLLKAIKISP